MRTLLPVALLVCLLAVVSAFPTDSVKWCVKSADEYRKCQTLKARVPTFCCVLKESTLACIIAIQQGTADAITLDGGDIYTAGLKNYNLKPIIAENYGTSSENCYYGVAVAKRNSGFGFKELKGKRTCHTGLGKSVGWNIPIGTLLSMNLIKWTDSEDSSVITAVENYFNASCVPGARIDSNLCQLCKSGCSRSHKELYYDYAGAFRCLEESAGEVAFVKHLTVPDEKKSMYQLLCKDNTRADIDDYKTCHLAKVPAHAVVTRKDPVMANLIWKTLNSFKGVNLFSSEAYESKNLMFKDTTVKLVRLPASTDSFLYLGAEYMSVIRSLHKEHSPAAASGAIKWCTVKKAETEKCDNWALYNTAIECEKATSVDECLKKIMRKEADAVAVDGGEVYTAGMCGLVPAMVEQYDEQKCNSGEAVASSYHAIAVVKKDSGITWKTLRGKRSCHTGVGRTAGWNIPMGHVFNETQSCDFSEYFPSGCAPGANKTSSFCKECIGSGSEVDDDSKCQANNDERYYGYAGAFRCLVEGKGDVAFIKNGIVEENTSKMSPEWTTKNADDFRLICPNKADPVKVSEYATCHLAVVPAHAVVTRPEMHSKVVQILKDQQTSMRNDSQNSFQMFKSGNDKNLIFKDSTKCLQEVKAGTSFAQFLGQEYMRAIKILRKCSDSVSELEKACTAHSCQQEI